MADFISLPSTGASPVIINLDLVIAVVPDGKNEKQTLFLTLASGEGKVIVVGAPFASIKRILGKEKL